MKTYETIWLASVVITIIGCIYWQWRINEHKLAAAINERYLQAEEIYARNRARKDAYMAECYRLTDIHNRCLANSTRYRYSRSTLRKTR